MRRNVSVWMIAVAVLLVAVVALGSVAYAKRPGPVPGGCPWKNLNCLDVWDPVTCSNGVTYSNACYALRACATGCTGGGATY